jgi:hypothetical protein
MLSLAMTVAVLAVQARLPNLYLAVPVAHLNGTTTTLQDYLPTDNAKPCVVRRSWS